MRPWARPNHADNTSTAPTKPVAIARATVRLTSTTPVDWSSAVTPAPMSSTLKVSGPRNERGAVARGARRVRCGGSRAR